VSGLDARLSNQSKRVIDSRRSVCIVSALSSRSGMIEISEATVETIQRLAG
jgi:hypothetical protein